MRSAYLAAVALAVLEHAWVVARGHVPRTPHLIVDVLAERRGHGTGLAGAETEHGVGNKVLPDGEYS